MSTLKTNNIQHVDLADPSILLNSDGSVSIAGTVSYEDATNVDSVGVVTARKQLHVGTGVSIAAGGLNVTAGITTVQALQATTGTFSGDVDLGNANSDTITMAGRVDSDLNPSGSTRDLGTTGAEWRNVYTANGVVASDKIALHASDTDTMIRFPAVDTITAETAGSERVRIDAAGDIFVGTTSDIAPANGTNLCVSDGTISRIILEKQSTIKFGLNVADSFQIYDETNSASRFSISSNGRFGFNYAGTPSNDMLLKSASAHTSLAVYSGSESTKGIFQTVQDDDIRFGSTSNHPVSFYANSNQYFHLTTGGHLCIGTENIASVSDGEVPKLQIKGPDSTAGISLVRYSADAGGSGIYIAKSRNTTHGSNTILQDNDELGRITFSGDDGNDLHTQGVQLKAEVGGTPGGNGMPADFAIFTNPGVASVSERLRITANGRVLVRTTTNNGCKFVVNQAENDTMATSGNMTTGFFLGASGMSSAALNIGTDNTDIWFNAAYANNAGVARSFKFYTGASERLEIRTDGGFDFPHSGFLTADGDLTVNLGSGLSDGSFAQVIAPGVLAHTGMYAIKVFWDFNSQGGAPYYCSASFLFSAVATNNTGPNKTENLISSCHIGGDYYLAARSRTGSSSSTGLEIQINGWSAAANSRFLVQYKRIF